jgi:cysteine desulfurase
LIYLDHQATAPTDDRVIDAMLPWWRERAANAHSPHALGRAARDAVEEARGTVAALIGADASEIVFTSGATEASNLALRGMLGPKQHAVTTTIEHSCVRETLHVLSGAGLVVTEVQVSGEGLVDPDAVEAAVRPETRLVSIMAVNNEVGTIQPIADIGAICRSSGVVFHTDAAQAAGKIPVDVAGMNIDLLSISAHKLYGPQGIGALYCRKALHSQLSPILTGGGQERGLRSGTLPTALCVGFGEACRIAAAEMSAEAGRLAALRSVFLDRLLAMLDGVRVNGSLDERIPGNLNLTFAGIDAESLLYRLEDVALSTGSACSSAAITPSHVLLAMGLEQEAAEASVRIGFGRKTTRAEVETAAGRISDEVKSLRLSSGSPRVAASGGTRKRSGL